MFCKCWLLTGWHQPGERPQDISLAKAEARTMRICKTRERQDNERIKAGDKP